MTSDSEYLKRARAALRGPAGFLLPVDEMERAVARALEEAERIYTENREQ